MVGAGAEGASGCEAVVSAGGDVAFDRLVCYLTIFGVGSLSFSLFADRLLATLAARSSLFFSFLSGDFGSLGKVFYFYAFSLEPAAAFALFLSLALISDG